MERVIGHFEIDGVRIARVEKTPELDVRFLSQRQLETLKAQSLNAAADAQAELTRRAKIVVERS